MPAFKPAYLIHGDDHGRIAERRARLRAVAEAESGVGGIQADQKLAPPAVPLLAVRVGVARGLTAEQRMAGRIARVGHEAVGKGADAGVDAKVHRGDFNRGIAGCRAKLGGDFLALFGRANGHDDMSASPGKRAHSFDAKP